jgi:hypothetical protein
MSWYICGSCGLLSKCILYEAGIISVRSDDNQASSKYVAKKCFEQSICTELTVVYQWYNVSL